MPGIATNFTMLDRARTALQAELAQHAEFVPILEALDEEPAFAHLGVVGPAIADFMQPDPVGNAYARLWRQVYGLIGDNLAHADGRGLFSSLTFVREAIDRAMAVAEGESLPELVAIRHLDDDVKEAVEDAEAVMDLIDAAYVTDLGRLILDDLTPSVTPPLAPWEERAREIEAMQGLSDQEQQLLFLEFLTSDYHPIPSIGEWSFRELLHWSRSGQFAQALLTRAEASGDIRLRAYAYGYLISYVGNVVGNPFLNSVVGSTFRLRWWRSRWISLFVDAWVHGYYEAGASMQGDVPTPPYEEWPSLANAWLHKRIELDPATPPDPQALMLRLWNADTFEAVLPPEFTAYWIGAFGDVYGDLRQFADLTENTLNGAFQLTWLLLWFQTSGEVFPLIPSAIETLEEDEDCGTAPPWVNPPGLLRDDEDDAGAEEEVPPSGIEGPNEKRVRCLLILKILFGILDPIGIIGQTGVGVTGALAEVAPDWKEFRCSLFWRRQYLNLTLLSFHDLLVLVGLVHPYPRHLSTETDVEVPTEDGEGVVATDLVTYHSAQKTVKSQAPISFPLRAATNSLLELMDLTSDDLSTEQFFWTDLPPGQLATIVEEPATVAYGGAPGYPHQFVDGGADVVGQGILGDPDIPEGPTGSTPSAFGIGNVLGNVVHLFSDLGHDLPNWNLDGDRGTDYPTWRFTSTDYPNVDPVSIEQVD